MKKILLISYDWLPRGSVGMLRTLKFAKQLLKLGYGISVLTKEEEGRGSVSWDIVEPILDKVDIYKVPASRVRAVSRILENRYFKIEKDWFEAFLKKMDGLFGSIDFDIMISTSPPESAHLIAAEIKKRYGIPWIADLRDLWVDDHYRNFDPLRKMLFSREEKRILGKADAIVTVSKIWADSLMKRYGDKVSVITNGYDKEFFDKTPLVKSKKFLISYLGKLNSGHQDVSKLFEVVCGLIKNGNIAREDIMIDFYISGYGKPDISKIASSYGMSDVVSEHGPIPFSKALGVMKNSSLLLLVGWMGVSSAGWRPQKIYEYLGSGTPVILVNGRENTELLKILGLTREGAENIGEDILKFYKEFKDAGEVKKRSAPLEFSVSNITKDLCRIIENTPIR